MRESGQVPFLTVVAEHRELAANGGAYLILIRGVHPCVGDWRLSLLELVRRPLVGTGDLRDISRSLSAPYLLLQDGFYILSLDYTRPFTLPVQTLLWLDGMSAFGGESAVVGLKSLSGFM